MRLLLALLAALVLAPAAAAAPHVVMNFGDGPGAGPPGSLRYILTTAKSGDTITFQSPSVVMVTRPIVVPAGVNDLVINGDVSGAKAAIRSLAGGRSAVGLSVRGNRVTIQNIVFTDASLDVGAGNVPQGNRVLNNVFTGGRSGLSADESAGTLVQDNVFESSAAQALDADSTRNMKILHNRFAGSGSAIGAEDTHFLIVERNEFATGKTLLVMDGGRLVDNDFTGGSLTLRTIVGDAIRGVRVAGNEATGGGLFGFAADGGLVLEKNTFTGVRRVELGCLPNSSRGPELRFLNNVVVGGGGILAGSHCGRSGRIDIASARVEGTTFASLVVIGGEVKVRSSTFTGGAGGVLVGRGAEADVRGGQIVANRGAGVLIQRSPRSTTVSRVVMGGNTGPGIDRVPVGVSPRAAPGAPTLVYDEKKGKLRGKACPRCLVEIYESEEGAKTGNPGHGEGIRFLGVVKANGLGRFVYPARGDFDCPASGLVTATATHTLKGTSEFSPDEPCSCVISARFGVDPNQVPTTGFANFGISVFFEPGSIVKAAELTDTATDLRPPDNALGPSFNWQELRNEPFSPGGAYDFFVNVGYNPGAPAPATGPYQVWRYTVPYEPPDSAQGACRAILDFVFLTPPPE